MEMPEGWKKLKNWEDRFRGYNLSAEDHADLMKEMAEALEVLERHMKHIGYHYGLSALQKFKEWK